VPFNKELIIKAGQERMVPMMMTALTSGIALIPLVLAPGEPGKEILYPVATVIVGGLLSSTLLDFFATPATFWLFGRKVVQRMIDTSDTRDAEAEMLHLEDVIEKTTTDF